MQEKMGLGARMKEYEFQETKRHAISLLPLMVRLDGINFHSYCQHLDKPFDKELSSLMIATTEFLAKEYVVKAAYTQSDEITLCWNQEEYKQELLCGGKFQKLATVLAGKASAFFTSNISSYLKDKPVEKMAAFDARVWNVPNLTEAANTFLWRELDATRNSIMSAARYFFSQKECHKKNGSQLQEMLFQQGINWNNYSNIQKRGLFILQRKFKTPYAAAQLESLPPEHHARKDPNLTIEYTRYTKFPDLPTFSKVINREAFLFEGAAPINMSSNPQDLNNPSLCHE